MEDFNEEQSIIALKVRFALIKASLFLNLILSVVLGIVIFNLLGFELDNIILDIIIFMIISVILHFLLKPFIAILFRFIEIPIMGFTIMYHMKHNKIDTDIDTVLKNNEHKCLIPVRRSISTAKCSDCPVAEGCIEKKESISYQDIVTESGQIYQIPNENIKTKTINIKARNKFPHSDLNVIEIYNKLKNSKSLTFELIWDKFENIQCFNDIVLYENVENDSNGAYSVNISHFIDKDGKDCITYFSSLPNKAIDFLLFQLILEYFSGEFYYNLLATNSDDVHSYKEKLKELKPDSNHAFLYGPYPYYYEKENTSYIQAFIEERTGAVLFVDICILQGENYKIRNTTEIEGPSILF